MQRYGYQHMDMVWATLCLQDFYTFAFTKIS